MIKRLGLFTDPHFNFMSYGQVPKGYFDCVEDCEAILITGDLAEYPSLEYTLMQVSDEAQKPVYFVLGNHDFYDATIPIREACEEVHNFCNESGNSLTYLTHSPPIKLNKTTYLVGTDGHADMQFPVNKQHMYRVTYRLNDHNYIPDYKDLMPEAIENIRRELALEGAQNFKTKVDSLLVNNTDIKNIIVATHVPPFYKLGWDPTRFKDSIFHLAFYNDSAMSEVLHELANTYKETKFTVYSGHVHIQDSKEISANLIGHTGAAEYMQHNYVDTIIL